MMMKKKKMMMMMMMIMIMMMMMMLMMHRPLRLDLASPKPPIPSLQTALVGRPAPRR